MRQLYSTLVLMVYAVFVCASPIVRVNQSIPLRSDTRIQPSPHVGNHSVLVIRVEFQSDTDGTTYGDGRFVLRSLSERVTTKMDYFTIFEQAEVEAEYVYADGTEVHTYSLRDYFREVSNDLFDLNEIEMTDILTLSLPMAYYGDDTDVTLSYSRLVSDALLAASAYAVKAYDFIVVLHAGAGEESDTTGTFSGDILSGVLTAEAFFEKTGTQLQFGAYPCSSVIILPETQTRGSSTRGLLGSAAFTFGQAMGMPLTFNMDGLTSGLGLWDLMAYGLWNYNGFAPMHPTLYTKSLMGWATITEIDVNGQYQLSTSSAEFATGEWTGNQGLKIRINGSEYFLLEYRERRGIEKYFENGYSVRETGIHSSGKKIISETCIPMGMMIYHIRPDVIAQMPAAPLYGSLKGIDIEEADGFNELDKPWGHTGSIGDVYDCFSDHPAKKFRWTRFNDRTTPSAKDSEAAISGISVHSIQCNPDTFIATLTVENTRADYFPLPTAQALFASKDFYCSDLRTVKDFVSDSTVHVFPEGESVLYVCEDMIFTNKGVYEYGNLSTIRTAFPFDVLQIHKEGEFWYCIGAYNVAQLNSVFGITATTAYTGAERALYYDSEWYFYKNTAWYLNGNRLGEIVLQQGDMIYYADGTMVYRRENGMANRIHDLKEKPNDFIFADYDGDNSVEMIVAYPESIVFYTEKGDIERTLPFSNVHFVSLAKDGNDYYIFTYGYTVKRVNISNWAETHYPSVSIVTFDNISDDVIAYHDASAHYRFAGLTMYRTGAVAENATMTSSSQQDASIIVYPNPVKGTSVTIRLNAVAGEQAEISLYNARFQRVAHFLRSLHGGENFLQLDISNIAEGTYLCVVETNGHKKQIKLSILR